MNLVYKKHITSVEIAQHGSQVTGFFKHWPRGGFKRCAHLLRHDICKGSFTETWRAKYQRMVQCFATIFRGLDKNGHLLFDTILANVFIKPQRP